MSLLLQSFSLIFQDATSSFQTDLEGNKLEWKNLDGVGVGVGVNISLVVVADDPCLELMKEAGDGGFARVEEEELLGGDDGLDVL